MTALLEQTNGFHQAFGLVRGRPFRDPLADCQGISSGAADPLDGASELQLIRAQLQLAAVPLSLLSGLKSGRLVRSGAYVRSDD